MFVCCFLRFCICCFSSWVLLGLCFLNWYQTVLNKLWFINLCMCLHMFSLELDQTSIIYIYIYIFIYINNRGTGARHNFDKAGFLQGGCPPAGGPVRPHCLLLSFLAGFCMLLSTYGRGWAVLWKSITKVAHNGFSKRGQICNLPVPAQVLCGFRFPVCMLYHQ